MNTVVRMFVGVLVCTPVCTPGCKRDGAATGDTGTGDASSAGGDTGPATAGSADTTSGHGAGSSEDGDPPPGGGTGDAPTACGSGSAAALAACVDPSALAEDIGFIADIRTPGSAHWLAVQELCADRLEQLGYAVELHEYGTGTNVIGRRSGSASPEDVVLVGAHYDHIPDCLGADDNATGVAGALELARVLAEVPIDRTLAIACWDEEELGLLGSRAWVQSGMAAGETVSVYLNYDMIGVRSEEPGSQMIPAGLDLLFAEQYAQVEANEFRGDFVVVISDDLAEAPLASYLGHAEAIGLPTVSLPLDAEAKNSELLADLRRSDHASFWAQDIPAIFFSDTGELRNDAYHCYLAEDTVDTLDMAFVAEVVSATVGAAADTLGVGG